MLGTKSSLTDTTQSLLPVLKLNQHLTNQKSQTMFF